MNSFLIAGFTPIYKKIHFLNEEAEETGSGILDGSGGLEIFEGGIYGVFLEQQINLLEKNHIPFEIIG
ncbi:MAG: hypothetical protein UX81_C0010G0021 [Parcubacteria group bacterium GW2011_GWA2_47_12]|nr:MAG: hypothetical protein UX81_C0010G0021 [Parcubacteria group bacterium GW2011_GWA2_47_12]